MYAVLRLLTIWSMSFLSAFGQADYPPLPDGDYEIQSLLINRFINCNQVRVPHERCLVFVRPVTDTQYLDEHRLTDLKEQLIKQGKLISFVPDSSWVYFILTIKIGVQKISSRKQV
ncbi:hypothetical protein [Spirosoma fluminis]